MKRIRRRWVVVAVVTAGLVGAIAILDRPIDISSYQQLDDENMAVAVETAPWALLRVQSVEETSDAVVVSVTAFTFQPFPGTASAVRRWLTVHLGDPLDGRVVIDGQTGSPIPSATPGT